MTVETSFAITIVEFVLLSAAAFRLTQFFVFDSLIGANLDSGSRFADALDDFAYDTNGNDRTWLRGKIGDLLTCPWCLGFWISAACYLTFVIAAGRWGDHELVAHAIGVFAVAGVQGTLNAIVP